MSRKSTTIHHDVFATGRPGAGAIIALSLLAIVLIVTNIAVFLLSIWALVFGLTDMANVGVNFWAFVWVALGAVGVLTFIGRAVRS